jgi:DNA-binding response OmpR family regulator
MLEMASTVKAVLRRGGSSWPDEIAVGDIVLDKSARTVAVAGRDVQLARKEYALLELFLSHPRQVFTRETLLERVWGTDATLETRTVDMHIASLRSKLGRSDAVETVRGFGYKLGGMK